MRPIQETDKTKIALEIYKKIAQIASLYPND